MKHIILIILLTLGVWGQEIGVPYVDTREAVAQSAALSPDGETFYTYANNTLTHWSLSPVKVLESVKIEDADFSNQRLVNIYITPDQKRMLFVDKKKTFGVFDLSAKKFTNKIHEQFYRANLIGSYLVAIDTDKTMKFWNTLDLKEEKSIKIDNLVLNCDECSDFPLALLKSEDENVIILVTGIRMVAIDAKTLKIIKDVISYNKDFYLSLDHQIIVGMEQSFNIQTLQTIPSLSYEWVKENSNESFFHYQFQTQSIVNHLILFNHRGYSFYRKQSKQLLASLHQFKDGTWIVITPDGYFDRSEGSLKYLKKKLSSGGTFATPDGMIRTPPALDIVDEAMIQKYHKQINLKD